MQKVISINLNGNAFQLDESGYDVLREYLACAERQLKDNPDRTEILGDLEQAIADKCQKYLGPHQTVVAGKEVEQIVAEMGPVDGPAGANAEPAGTSTATGSKADEAQTLPSQRLYRVPAGSMIAGVCTGLAGYFHVDVTFVRIGFVLAALVTRGVAIVAYVVMMFVIPEATTPEEAEGGTPLSAKEVIDRATQRSKVTGTEWRRQWRHQRRQWRRQWHMDVPPAYRPSPLAAIVLPVFGLAQIALFLIMATMLISLVNTGGILDWHLPADVPVWAGALILLVGYQVVVSPIRAVRHSMWYPAATPLAPPFAFWNAVGWLIGLAFVLWLASDHVPEIREFVQRVPDLVHDFVSAMRDLGSK